MRRSAWRAHELAIENGACGMHTSYRRSMGKVGSTLKRPCFPRRFDGAFVGAASSVFLVRARLAGFLVAERALDMAAFERIYEQPPTFLVCLRGVHHRAGSGRHSR